MEPWLCLAPWGALQVQRAARPPRSGHRVRAPGGGPSSLASSQTRRSWEARSEVRPSCLHPSWPCSHAAGAPKAAAGVAAPAWQTVRLSCPRAGPSGLLGREVRGQRLAAVFPAAKGKDGCPGGVARQGRAPALPEFLPLGRKTLEEPQGHRQQELTCSHPHSCGAPHSSREVEGARLSTQHSEWTHNVVHPHDGPLLSRKKEGHSGPATARWALGTWCSVE
ncbi:uncharacterized protein LOC116666564 [Camelus ferus]|uniref:Uncharacterized protein LOC116666564 n=1 Tax=Camelus ferus TaxID=419612 RepID=A0A8B8TW50_CAMFR|nr:uncharacterized protein LOC116666564 [Camelus ferus]